MTVFFTFETPFMGRSALPSGWMVRLAVKRYAESSVAHGGRNPALRADPLRLRAERDGARAWRGPKLCGVGWVPRLCPLWGGLAGLGGGPDYEKLARVCPSTRRPAGRLVIRRGD